MPLFAASLEGLLVFLVIVLLSAVSNWLKQRKEQELHQRRGAAPGQTQAAPPATQQADSAQPPQPRALDWQEELRRLIEGDREPAEPRPIQPAPSPAKEPEPVPVPPLLPQRRLAPATSSLRPAATKPTAPSPAPPTPTPARTHPPPDSETTDLAGPHPSQLAALTVSAAVYKQASQLAAHTAARLEKVAQWKGPSAPSQPGSRLPALSPEAAQVRAHLRHPRSARQVVVASVVLGRAKAYEESTWTWP